MRFVNPNRIPHLRLLTLFIFLLSVSLAPLPSAAQEEPPVTPAPSEAPIEAPSRVDVEPVARDGQIEARLQNILVSTGWFASPTVEVNNGVVFLRGQTETEEFKKWAGDLARNTQDVAAVVNQITLREPSIWDFEPALASLRQQGRSLVRAFPLIGFSLLVLLITAVITKLAMKVAHPLLNRRLNNALLVNISTRAVGLGVFLVGLYLIFQVAGLTNIAFTVIGGTGLLGLILGIAFRGITENFLSSIFLSMQNPFHKGDLIEVDGIVGYVQLMNTRTTVLMTLDGNHVQVPNVIVYNSKILNYTSNPNRRVEFTVGVGYDGLITAAQETIMAILIAHPAVLNDPEPLVLVDNLGSASVNMKTYFWVNGREHGFLKVRSSVIRQVKRAFQEANISMPDEAREMIFPQGVTVRLVDGEGNGRVRPVADPPPILHETATISTGAEGGLRSEAPEIEEQARHARTPEDGENLLEPAP
jgi:small conductance mechanosensitive channel